MQRRRGYPPVLKRLGQHFLNDRSALADIVSALKLHGDEVVVEIGAGRGALTEQLLPTAGHVIAVEIDRELADRLRKSHEGDGRMDVIEADVLTLRFSDIVTPPFAVVGNVPYYITTPILFHVLQPPFPVRAVFLVQREVAERIIAQPGGRDYGALSVNVQAIATAELVRVVPPGAFTPPPKVDSAIVRITPLANSIVRPDELADFRVFVLAIFGMRRKQMANVLRSVRRVSLEDAARILTDLGLDPKARPETFSPTQLAEVMRATT